jgi:hypothetical protein
MKAETWLPILTLVLGWGLAQVTEVLRDRRATNRDRLARRAELQRMTLLELQEALADLGLGLIGSTFDQLGVGPAYDKQGPFKHAAEATLRFPATRGRVRLLASRVEDERARELVTATVKASMELEAQLGAEDFKSAARTAQELIADQRAAVARIGELLRERY